MKAFITSLAQKTFVMNIEIAAIHSLLLLFFLMNFFFSGENQENNSYLYFSFAKIGYLISLTVYEE